MTQPRPLLAAVAAAAAIAATATGAAASTGAGAQHKALPHRLFAPYFDTYDTTNGSLATLSQESGCKYLSLAFLQTATAGSCTVQAPVSTSRPGTSATSSSISPRNRNPTAEPGLVTGGQVGVRLATEGGVIRDGIAS